MQRAGEAAVFQVPVGCLCPSTEGHSSWPSGRCNSRPTGVTLALSVHLLWGKLQNSQNLLPLGVPSTMMQSPKYSCY